MNFSKEEIEEAMECLIKADEIRNNNELMKELEPALKEQKARIDKVLSLKDLWKLGLKEAVAKENAEKEVQSDYFNKKEDDPNEDETSRDEKQMHKGEKPLVKEDAKIMGRS